MYVHLYGIGGLVATHSAAGAKGPGSMTRSPEHIWDLILGPIDWQASIVGDARYDCTQTVIV